MRVVDGQCFHYLEASCLFVMLVLVGHNHVNMNEGKTEFSKTNVLLWADQYDR